MAEWAVALVRCEYTLVQSPILLSMCSVLAVHHDVPSNQCTTSVTSRSNCDGPVSLTKFQESYPQLLASNFYHWHYQVLPMPMDLLLHGINRIVSSWERWQNVTKLPLLWSYLRYRWSRASVVLHRRDVECVSLPLMVSQLLQWMVGVWQPTLTFDGIPTLVCPLPQYVE